MEWSISLDHMIWSLENKINEFDRWRSKTVFGKPCETSMETENNHFKIVKLKLKVSWSVEITIFKSLEMK